MKKKINIIGAGISGLTAGCYLQMNGYDTEIFELHNLPGGLCTSWKRGDYNFDGCIHWLVGSSPEDNFYHLWNELVDMKKINFVYHDLYSRVYGKDGQYIDIFNDIDKLEQELLLKAPEDRVLILSFTKAIRKFIPFENIVDKAPEVQNFADKFSFLFKMFPYLSAFNKWMKIKSKDFAAQCKNPLLRNVFEIFFEPNMSMIFLIFSMSWFVKKAAGYPIGGSLTFAKEIENRYTALGGKINYHAKVEKINTLSENRKEIATGITLADGSIKNADITISAADGHYTIYKMLEGKYVNEKINKRYQSALTFSSYVQVSLGINRSLDKELHIQSIYPEKPIIIDDKTNASQIGVHIFNYDPTMAPEGKTVINSLILTDNHEYWLNLKKDNLSKYKAEKDRIAKEVIAAIDKHIGNIADYVEEIDVSTPSTVIRYTNNWKGSFEGWILTPESGFMSYERELPGLKNFYMAGQWVEPGGGLPGALLSGRNVTQLICKKDKKKFKTFSF